MIKNKRLLDGYAVNAVDGYQFSTNWVDMLNCMELSVSVVFVGGNPNGTITIDTSNDWPDSVNGFVPLSAYVAGSPNIRNGPAIDSSEYPGSSTAVAGAGIYKISIQNMGERWFRVEFAVSIDSITTATVLYTAKTTNA